MNYTITPIKGTDITGVGPRAHRVHNPRIVVAMAWPDASAKNMTNRSEVGIVIVQSLAPVEVLEYGTCLVEASPI